MKKLSIIVTYIIAVMVLASTGAYADHDLAHVVSPLQKIDENKDQAMTEAALSTLSEVEKKHNYKSISFTFINAVYRETCDSDLMIYNGKLEQNAFEGQCEAILDIPLPAGSVIRRVELLQSGSDESEHGDFYISVNTFLERTVNYAYPEKFGYNKLDTYEVYFEDLNWTLLTNTVLQITVQAEEEPQLSYSMLGITVYYE